ncbi:MAG: restriction endonuclease subunit S, partial [Hyphomonadaceae bacterium]|nr:restriction endonuclease subunit S [Hyphomonadaceae bacterium]
MKNGDNRPEGPVPALRFPKFRDAPPWEVKRLGEVGEFIGGGTPDTSVPGYWNGKMAWVSSSDLTDEDIFSLNIDKRITDEAIQSSATKIVPRGAVLIVTRVGVGKCALAPEDLCTSQDFTNFIPRYGLPSYFAYWLLSNRNRLLSLQQGTSIKGVSMSDLKAIKIPLPSLPEQREIAGCLSSLDDLIEAREGQVAALKLHKRGLMQKLFPAPGETTPALRFPEFRDTPPWQVKRLGEVADIKRGASPRPISSPIWFDDESDIGWVRISDVTASGRVLLKTTQNLSQEGVKKSRIVPPGHIIMSICGTIGKPICTGF